ncbi:hypothetical protein [Streptomyces sp. NPDC045714]|uniref:hypothetical protein n=1 Tax=Streptomyces sp. NPDC045714 TaxID=3154913 RepID=UPI0033C6658E
MSRGRSAGPVGRGGRLLLLLLLLLPEPATDGYFPEPAAGCCRRSRAGRDR